MEGYDSISSHFIQKSAEKYLEKVKRLACHFCTNIALPPYRIIDMKNVVFCNTCLKKQKQDRSKITEATEIDLEILDHILLSCKNYKNGCKETYIVKQKKNLAQHEADCKYAKARNEREMSSPSRNLKDKLSSENTFTQLKNDLKGSDKKIDESYRNLERKVDEIMREFNKFKKNSERNAKIRENQLFYEKDQQIKDLQQEQFKLIRTLNYIQNIQKRNNSHVFYSKTFSMSENNTEEKIAYIPIPQYTKDPLTLKPEKEFITITNYYGFACANNICLYENLKKELILAYPSKTDSLELVNIITKEKLVSLKGHSNCIWCIRSFIDKTTNFQYLITSSKDRTIKIWKDNECFLTIKDAHKSNYLYSCLMLNNENKTFIVTSSESAEMMKIFDLEGKLQRTIGSDKDESLFINIIHYKGARYLLNCNHHDVKLYDFSTGSLFRQFQQENKDSFHYCAFTDESKLYESDDCGVFRVWEIENSNLLVVLESFGVMLFGIVPWNKTFVLSAGYDGNIKVFDIEKKECMSLPGQHKGSLGTLIKFQNELLGECLICAGGDNRISLLR